MILLLLRNNYIFVLFLAQRKTTVILVGILNTCVKTSVFGAVCQNGSSSTIAIFALKEKLGSRGPRYVETFKFYRF